MKAVAALEPLAPKKLLLLGRRLGEDCSSG